MCETGAIQCLQAAHKVLTKEQSEAALRQRLQRMQRELLTEDRQKEAELSDLSREVVQAEQRRDAKLAEVQEGKKHLGSLEHLLDAQRCKALSAEALPFMVHVRAFEQRRPPVALSF